VADELSAGAQRGPVRVSACLSFERLFHGHPAHAAETLPPLIRNAAALRVKDEQQVEVLAEAMLQACTAGIDASEDGKRFARRPSTPPD